MNRKQKTFLWIGIAVIVLMGIFPPWISKVEILNSTNQRNAGYGCILNPPTTNSPTWYVRIDTSRLSVQWVVIAVITSGLILTFKGKKDH